MTIFLRLMSLVSLLSFSAATVYAASYTADYHFSEPQFKKYSNGTQLVTVPETMLDSRSIGAPQLPMRFSNIYIPENEKVVDIQIETAAPVLLPGLYNIMPVQQPYPIGEKAEPTKPDPQIYGANSNFPGVLHQWNRMKRVKGINIAQTRLFPLQYNPVQGTLEFYRSIKVTLVTEEKSEMMPAMSMVNKARYRNNTADDIAIRNAIDNRDDFSIMQPAVAMEDEDLETREYVVITTAAMAMAFQELTDYRETEEGGGYTTHIETMENIEANYAGRDRAEQVRNFIIEQYNNYGTQFVLLGGDADGEQENHLVPTRGAYVKINDYTDDNIISDYYFACLDGDWNGDNDELWGESNDGIDGGDIDWDPEIAVGRIPADTAAEASTQITKIISFETMEQPPYRGLLVGELLNEDRYGGDDLDITYQNSNHMPADRLYDRNVYEGGWNKTQLVELINSDKYNLILHMGHSTVHDNMHLHVNGNQDNDIDLLTNTTPVLVYSSGCYPASFDNRSSRKKMEDDPTYNSIDSIAEVLTVESSSGAYAYIGNSRYGWYMPSSPSWLSVTDFFKGKFVEYTIGQQTHTRIGTALSHVKTTLDYEYPGQRWDGFDLNLLGDPASKINQNCPQNELIVSYLGPKTDNHKTPNQPYFFKVNTSIIIKANVHISCVGLFDGAEVIAGFANGEESLSLNDNGVDGDEIAHDGVYSATWIPIIPDDNVVMTLTASADGYISGQDSFNFMVLDEWEYAFDDTAIFEWIDISDGEVADMPGKWGGKSVDVGFMFGFYGDLYRNLWLYPTGFISTGPDPKMEEGSPLWSTEIPTHRTPNGFMPVLHSFFIYDGNTEKGTIYYKTIGDVPNRKFVVTWQDVLMKGQDPITFQAILFEKTGQIKYQYKDLYTGDDKSSYGLQSLIGIENNEGTYGNQYSNSESGIEISDGTAILLTPDRYIETEKECIEYSATNADHEQEGRAYSETKKVDQICFGTFCWGGRYETTWFANGSDINLGTNPDGITILTEEPPGSGVYILGNCPIPRIESYEVIVIDDDAIITGNATGGDADIEKVEVDINADWSCSGTNEFTCTISDLYPGENVAMLSVYDTKGNKSGFKIVEFTVYEPTPPDVGELQVAVIDSILTVEGIVNDINNDQQIMLFGINEMGHPAVVCEIIDTKFKCELDASEFEEGTHVLPLAAVDSRGQLSEIIEVEFEIQDGKYPVIESFDYSVGEKNLTVTGMASDADDDLSYIQLEYANGEEVYNCSGTYDFECLILNHEVGEFDFVIAAYDEAGNRSESDMFTVEFLPAECINDTNQNHFNAGRAIKKYYYLYYATGTEDFLGYSMNTTSLKKVPSQGWQKVSSCE